jgi:hypothetical protein
MGVMRSGGGIEGRREGAGCCCFCCCRCGGCVKAPRLLEKRPPLLLLPPPPPLPAATKPPLPLEGMAAWWGAGEAAARRLPRPMLPARGLCGRDTPVKPSNKPGASLTGACCDL